MQLTSTGCCEGAAIKANVNCTLNAAVRMEFLGFAVIP